MPKTAASAAANPNSFTKGLILPRKRTIPPGGMSYSPHGYREHDRDARLHRDQGPAADPPPPDRGPDRRNPADGRRGPLLHRRADPDLSRAGSPRQGRPRPDGRPRTPLRRGRPLV